MTGSELKRKDTIEAAARVVCARLKRQGIKQPWRPVLDFLDKFDNPDCEEAKTAAVAHFLTGTSKLVPINNNDKLATNTPGVNSDLSPVSSDFFDSNLPPRTVTHRSDSNDGGLAITSSTSQTELIRKEAINLGLTLTETDIQLIGSELENKHGRLCTETALIVDALKQWVALLEEQTKTELDRLHAGLSETISTSHGRIAKKVSDIFSNAKTQHQEYVVAQTQEIEKIKSFFAARGVEVRQS